MFEASTDSPGKTTEASTDADREITVASTNPYGETTEASTDSAGETTEASTDAEGATTEASIDDNAPHLWNISREMWLADTFRHTDTTDKYDPLKLVIIQHTVSSECHYLNDCTAAVRNLQRYFLTDPSLGYDIPYNFLIGNDGRVYEGRGWNIQGAHTLHFNRCSLGIGFIGDYRVTKVTPLQVERLNLLLKEGIARGHIDPKYYIVPAKDLTNPTESPGTNLYNAIKQWDTYDHELKFRNRSCDEIYGRV